MTNGEVAQTLLILLTDCMSNVLPLVIRVLIAMVLPFSFVCDVVDGEEA